MVRFFICIAFFANVLQANAQQKSALARPKLVVGIVVDQMRWDYLYRYYDRYEAGGLKKLMNEGFNCQNTMINYLPSFTGPGHASIYTGTVPAIHGIAANDWIDNKTGKGQYCVDDKTVNSIGGSVSAGKMSPANMIATTITDELEITTQQRALVYGIGIKDRGSILPAGHAADGAFWFDDSTGNFISSSFYMNDLPEWMKSFNAKKLPDSYMDKVWELLYPADTYISSMADNTAFEGKLAGEKAPTFPHKTPKINGKGYYGIRYMPWGNQLTFETAKTCVSGAGMGKDEITDFLCITLSTTDYAGHTYGPDALEMEDMYLRLDKDIAMFIEYLDKTVGKGNYTVFLSADHGAAHNSAYLNSLKIPAGTESEKNAGDRLDAYLKTKTGSDKLVIALSNYQVYLNEELIKKSNTNRDVVKKYISDWLYDQDGVEKVIDLENISDAIVPEAIANRVVNGYYKQRCGVMQVIMKPGWYSGYGNTGTTHGSWNPYDTHIPLLWYGWGIKKGETYRNVDMTDIAPTIAALLHIQMPNGCVGSVITEVLE